MIFSFSRLHLYEQCPYAFYTKYIEGTDGETNFYAENGSILHDIFKCLLLREITLDDATARYVDEFEDIADDTVELRTKEKTFDKCLNYLCTVNEFDWDRYEIIIVEQKVEFKIGKYNFVGFPDLVLRDKKSGEVILVDHKSSDHFLKKDGTVLKSKQADYNTYSKQMYVYCKGLKDIYELEVNKIVWHHFKDDGAITVTDFKQDDYEKTLAWCIYIIEKMKKDRVFTAKKTYMLCKNLCDYRNECEYQEEE